MGREGERNNVRVRGTTQNQLGLPANLALFEHIQQPQNDKAKPLLLSLLKIMMSAAIEGRNT